MRRKRGRPKKPEGETLDERIELRIDSSDKVALERAAMAAGIKPSDWIRAAIKAALGTAGPERNGERGNRTRPDKTGS
jgi:hypothetical protein